MKKYTMQKRKNSRVFYPVVLVFILSLSTIEGLKTAKRFTFKLDSAYKKEMLQELRRYNFSLLFEITPRISVFEYMGDLRDLQLDRLTGQIRARFKNQILSVKRDSVYENTFTPQDASLNFSMQEKCSEIDNHYGMAVSRAHALGYSGNGVVVAITDVGVDTDNLDLRGNIDEELCFNFISNSSNVTPEYFHNLQDISTPVTAHGDHCASIIGSVRGNGICTFGISYEATIVGLKIFNVTLNHGRHFSLEPPLTNRSDILARAFTHKLSRIDIFSNSWAPTKTFTTFEFQINDAIEYGALKGRHGLGTIYVVPAGPVGYELANNIYTITINGVGQHWTVPADSFVSASVITSGLSSGSNLSSSYLVTTSQRNRCVTSFRGVSAATAKIVAIIALALEANPNLTLRQLKGLLVQASELDETRTIFSINAAGHKFHMVFGFGLLNAERLVLLAKKSRPPLPLQTRSLMRYTGIYEQETAFCYSLDKNSSDTCLDTIEDVVIEMNLTNKCKRLNIILVSPSGTKSVLVPLEAELTEERNKKVQFTSVHFWNERAFGIWRLLLSYPSESCSGRAYIQEVSLTLYGTKALKASYNQEQHFADICSGFQNNEYTKQQTWGIVNLVVSDLLRNPSILTKAVFIALGFIFGITSLVLVHIFIYCKQKSSSLSTAQCGGI